MSTNNTYCTDFSPIASNTPIKLERRNLNLSPKPISIDEINNIFSPINNSAEQNNIENIKNTEVKDVQQQILENDFFAPIQSENLYNQHNDSNTSEPRIEKTFEESTPPLYPLQTEENVNNENEYIENPSQNYSNEINYEGLIISEADIIVWKTPPLSLGLSNKYILENTFCFFIALYISSA